MNRFNLYLFCQFFGWGVHGAFGLLVVVLGGGAPLTWRLLLAFALVQSLAGLYSHGLRAVIRRRGWLRLAPRFALPKALTLSVLAGIVITSASILLQTVLVDSPIPEQHFVIAFFWQAVSWAIAMAFWTVLYFGLKFYSRSRSSEVANLTLKTEAEDARLRLLQSQLNPHFLFNSLNVLRSLIGEDPVRAKQIVTELSDVLRHVLHATEAKEIAFKHELQGIEAYLKLEQVRFEDRLRFAINTDEASQDAQVPPMMVLVLVENAIKHGISSRPDGGGIVLNARMADGHLTVEVLNPGRLDTRSASMGLGLANARSRLATAYGDRADLALRNRDTDTVAATLRLPFRPERT